MVISKKIIVSFSLLSVIAFAASAAMEDKPEGFKNLKVLPKHTTREQLHGVMDEWSHALGVRCNFCHEFNADTKKMDFVSDAKPEKEMARHMFKMTAKINKKFFHGEKDANGMVVGGVNCNTCHRGTAHPPEPKAGGDDHKGPGGPGAPGAPGPDAKPQQ